MIPCLVAPVLVPVATATTPKRLLVHVGILSALAAALVFPAREAVGAITPLEDLGEETLSK